MKEAAGEPTPEPSERQSDPSIEQVRLVFETEQGPDGTVVARPQGWDPSYYYLEGGGGVEAQGKLYHLVLIHQDGGVATNALLAFDPQTEGLEIVWSATLRDVNHPLRSVFIASRGQPLIENEGRIVFLEPELDEAGGAIHLSEYDPMSGAIVRLRERFWPDDGRDALYSYHWNAELRKLLLYSWGGHIWIFDLANGDDRKPEGLFRVIPHSTSGYPSLFPSPDFERYAHNDESGKLTFYSDTGEKLGAAEIPSGAYVPSETVKWNPHGTVAWMESSPQERNRVRAMDIDLSIIAPKRLTFYDRDGRYLSALEAGGPEKAVDVAGWAGAEVALVKEYTISEHFSVHDQAANPGAAFAEKEHAYMLFDTRRGTKKSASANDIAAYAAVPIPQLRNPAVHHQQMTYAPNSFGNRVDESLAIVVARHLQAVRSGDEQLLRSTIIEGASSDSRVFMLWERRGESNAAASELKYQFGDEKAAVVDVTFQNGQRLSFALSKKEIGWKMYDID